MNNEKILNTKKETGLMNSISMTDILGEGRVRTYFPRGHRLMYYKITGRHRRKGREQ